MDGFRRMWGPDDVADLRPVSAGLQAFGGSHPCIRPTPEERSTNKRELASMELLGTSQPDIAFWSKLSFFLRCHHNGSKSIETRVNLHLEDGI